MPIPCKTPPYSEESKGCCVICGKKASKSVHTPKVATVNKQRKINFQPVYFKPSKKIGILIAIEIKPIGIFSLSKWIKVDKPDTPPATIPQGSKKSTMLKA